MNFDTVHEYTFDTNTHLHYCNDHETLIIVNHEGVTTNRLMISIPKEAIQLFITDMNKEQLNENLENHNHSTDAVEA